MDCGKNEGGQLMSRPNMYCLPNGSTYVSILKVLHAFKFVDLFHNIQNCTDILDIVIQPVLKFTNSVLSCIYLLYMLICLRENCMP